ncbi:MAG TPA: PSD1 and planctomycete cytochrome C domain-containing protein [Pirellulaceae bacterium]|nr:PSD1 and planctomycete cytochrome C domain-containing protein [Pirellulaceae bacterium]
MAASRLAVVLPLLMLWALSAVALAQPPKIDATKLPPAAEKKVDFVTDIQPLFKKNCFSCHGAEAQEGGLRLDHKKRAFDGGDHGKAIVPGKSAESRLVHLIAGLDEEIGLMPPDGMGTPLTPAAIGLVRAWIDQGANWPDSAGAALAGSDHWAFQPVKRHALPGATDSAWPSSAIDAFILARLEQEKLHPSPPAPRETLLRRAYLDLIGLLPSPDDVDAFAGATDPDAYERTVDRLLASPHYGERWGRYWLDQARYADSDGYEKDRPRPFAWRYRDWVISALNADMPFDRFTVEQIAGDLLPGATLAQQTAVGFHRNTLHNTEGGIDPEEDRVKKTVDRTNTIGTVWLGLTLGCTQCHSHKYDPISQREYYEMYAFFNNLDEKDIDAPMPEQAAKLAADKAAHAKRQSELDAAVKDYEQSKLTAALAAWEETAAKAPASWQPLSVKSATSAKGATLKAEPDGTVLASGKNENSDVYTVELSLPPGKYTAIRLEVLPDDKLPSKGPGRAPHGNFVLTKLSARTNTEIAFADARADFSQDKCDVKLALNDNAGDFWAVAPQFGKRHVAVFDAKEPFGGESESVITLTLDQTYPTGEPHNIGKFRVWVTSAPLPAPLEGLPENVAAALAVAKDQRTDAQRKAIGDYFRTIDAELIKLTKAAADHKAKPPALPADVKAQSVAQLDKPRVTNLLIRGDFLSPGDPVEAQTISVLPPLKPRGDQPDRLDLALWLADPLNPLTPRVTVNRLWQQLLGRGIVVTSDDFGKQGERPSHPELLDWLAAEFSQPSLKSKVQSPKSDGTNATLVWTLDSAWEIKRLIRKIVVSQTYRQSSSMRPELAERDPENILLARQSRRRVESEIIRDVALSASGLLSTRIGGPSVRPPQPAEYAAITYAGSAKWVESKDADRYRRGMYTFFQRTSPYPMLMTFDTPDTNECAVRRMTSNTPLQALTLWNDPVFTEAAQSLGLRIVGQVSNLSLQDRATFAFKVCLSRAPSESELADVLALHQAHLTTCRANEKASAAIVGNQTLPPGISTADAAAWIGVARALINLDEFITRD